MGNPSRVQVMGPLVPYVAGFRTELESQGYRRNAVADQLRLLAHVCRWLASQGLGESDLTPERIEEFLAVRRAAGYTLWRSPKGVAPLLAYLRGLAVAPVPEPVPPGTPAEDLLELYRTYLVEERGLAPGTVASDLYVARLFLATRAQVPGLYLEELTTSEVIDFVLSECRHRSTGSARYVVTGLRAFLRYCYLDGRTARPLADAVPTVAGWRLAGLPRAVDPRDVAALLRSCDRRTTFGRRDFAVLTLLVRLGLRAGEVAGLLLEDIDWRAGELVVRGKGPKQESLPLPPPLRGNSALPGGRPRSLPLAPSRLRVSLDGFIAPGSLGELMGQQWMELTGRDQASGPLAGTSGLTWFGQRLESVALASQ